MKIKLLAIMIWIWGPSAHAQSSLLDQLGEQVTNTNINEQKYISCMSEFDVIVSGTSYFYNPFASGAQGTLLTNPSYDAIIPLSSESDETYSRILDGTAALLADCDAMGAKLAVESNFEEKKHLIYSCSGFSVSEPNFVSKVYSIAHFSQFFIFNKESKRYSKVSISVNDLENSDVEAYLSGESGLCN